MKSADNYYLFTGYVKAETAKSCLFECELWEEHPDGAWLPKSQCIINRAPEGSLAEDTAEIPEWLCKKNGWDQLDE